MVPFVSPVMVHVRELVVVHVLTWLPAVAAVNAVAV